MSRTGNHDRLLRLCGTAVMTAIVFAGNYLRVTMPIAVGGQTSFTLANILCALAGLLLGPGRGFLAAGLGSALYDLTFPAFVMEAPITLFTKGAYGLVAGAVFHLLLVKVLKRSREGYLPQLAAALCAALGYLVVYSLKNFFYNGMLIEGYVTAGQCWAVVVAKLPASLFNGAVAVVFAPILGVALRKALRSAGLDRMLA